MILVLNIALGIIPTFILGASIAAGVDDDRQHRVMFVFIYGLWAITLAMWNWMRSAPWGWMAMWLAAGAIALMWTAFARRTAR